MSADIELLRLAAKAAGIDVGPNEFCDPLDRKYTCDLGLWVRTGFQDIGRWFNPLNDDGEALRLAVKLGLEIKVDLCDDTTRVNECDCEFLVEHKHFDGGVEAATRRAIVRAAAEIGRAMP